MEGANPDRAAALSLFHDTAELRLGDANWVARNYTDHENMKDKVLNDQLAGLPMMGGLKNIFDELKGLGTKEAIIALDADSLDMAIQSKYYFENGNKKSGLWFEGIKNSLRTNSAKEVYALLENTGIEEWWMELESIKKKFDSLRGNK